MVLRTRAARWPLATLAPALACGLVVVSASAAAQPRRTPSPQQADAARDEEARALFEAGRVAFDNGRFEDALGHFRRAHELSGRPQLLYNIGAAADKLRLDEQTLEAFRAYLAGVPDARNRAEVEARVAVLEQAVARQRELVAAAAAAQAGGRGSGTAAGAGAGDARAGDSGAGAGDAGAGAGGEGDRRPGDASARVAESLVGGAAGVSSASGSGAGDAGRGRDERRDEDGGALGQWWFWTLVGAAVVGGAVLVALAVTGGDQRAPLQTGSDGGVVMTLRFP
jgi:hypothetical protein